MKCIFLLIAISISTTLSAQITFESKLENFKIKLPVKPTEGIDTIQSDYGPIPRYLMLCKSIEHGRNLLYTVEIMNIEDIPDITFEDLKANYISRKQSVSGNISFELVHESKENVPVPYDIELVFLDRNGFLMYSRIIQKDYKFYTIETLRIKSQFKVGTKLNKDTREFFDSFELLN
ncbi:MAG: hypothetical protein RIC80_00795 [Cyclobacteriaceae bacterium]